MHTYISSRTNPLVKLLSSLQKKKGREDAGLYLCEGAKLCREAVGRCRVKYAVLREDKKEGELLSLCEKSGGEVIILSESAFEKISTDTSPDGIAFAVEAEELYGLPEREEKVIMLDCVRDPGNVGTVVRSAAAFGFDRVVLYDCADIYNPKTVRATMGAFFKIRFTVAKSIEEVIFAMKSDGRRVIAASLGEGALTLGESPLKRSDCIVIGNEGHGVSEETVKGATDLIKIPMTDKTESLNAAIAASVIMWEQR